MVINEVVIDDYVSFIVCNDYENHKIVNFTVINPIRQEIIVSKDLTFDKVFELINVLLKETLKH